MNDVKNIKVVKFIGSFQHITCKGWAIDVQFMFFVNSSFSNLSIHSHFVLEHVGWHFVPSLYLNVEKCQEIRLLNAWLMNSQNKRGRKREGG
jgi:hypothetical protein